MSHDPMCPVPMHDDAHWDWSYHCAGDPECEDIECRCEEVASIRANERKWVTESAAKEIRNHKVNDGVCACGMDALDPLEHYAWLLEVYINDDLKPRHEVESQ